MKVDKMKDKNVKYATRVSKSYKTIKIYFFATIKLVENNVRYVLIKFIFLLDLNKNQHQLH